MPATASDAPIVDEHPLSRHQERTGRMEALFAWSLSGTVDHDADFLTLFLPHQTEVDAQIMALAPKHSIDAFNKIDLAILRQALYELLYTETPPLVAVDEAIRLAKEYGGEEAPAFINGVLGAIVDRRKKEAEEHDSQSK
jgi:transcription termination factor NusB